MKLGARKKKSSRGNNKLDKSRVWQGVCGMKCGMLWQGGSQQGKWEVDSAAVF